MKTFTITLLMLASVLPIFASAFDPLPPVQRDFWSMNQKYCLRITPPESHEQAGNCHSTMYECDGTNRTAKWSRYLPNNASPCYVFISDNAQFIITIGDWYTGTLPVVVYHENFLMRAHTLESLGIEHPGQLVDTVDWAAGAKMFFGPDQESFIILLKSGQPIVILDGGDLLGPYQEPDKILAYIQTYKDEAKTIRQYGEESKDK